MAPGTARKRPVSQEFAEDSPAPQRRSQRTSHNADKRVAYSNNYHPLDAHTYPNRARKKRHNLGKFSQLQDQLDDDDEEPMLSIEPSPLLQKQQRTSVQSKPQPTSKGGPAALDADGFKVPPLRKAVKADRDHSGMVQLRTMTTKSMTIEEYSVQYVHAWEALAKNETSEAKVQRMAPLYIAKWESFALPNTQQQPTHVSDTSESEDEARDVVHADQQGKHDKDDVNDDVCGEEEHDHSEDGLEPDKALGSNAEDNSSSSESVSADEEDIEDGGVGLSSPHSPSSSRLFNDGRENAKSRPASLHDMHSSQQHQEDPASSHDAAIEYGPIATNSQTPYSTVTPAQFAAFSNPATVDPKDLSLDKPQDALNDISNFDFLAGSASSTSTLGASKRQSNSTSSAEVNGSGRGTVAGRKWGAVSRR
ncbi:MAG: hypothetical protein Q9162_001138 [Coniocarpon cinnabarinum]